MGEPYVTTPGTSGRHFSLPDVNKADADTAHGHQGRGGWPLTSYRTTLDEDVAIPAGGPMADLATGLGFHINASGDGETDSYMRVYRTHLDVAYLDELVACLWIYVESAADLPLKFAPDIAGYNGTSYVSGGTSWVENDSVDITAVGWYKIPFQFDVANASVDSVEVGVRVQGKTGTTLTEDDSFIIGGLLFAHRADIADVDDPDWIPSLRIKKKCDLIARFAPDDWSAGVQVIVSSQPSGDTLNGYQLYINGSLLYGYAGDGSANRVDWSDSLSGKITDEVLATARYLFDPDTGDTEFWLDGESVGTGSEATGYITPGGDIHVGMQANGSQRFTGKIASVEIYDGDSDDGAPRVGNFQASQVLAEVA